MVQQRAHHGAVGDEGEEIPAAGMGVEHQVRLDQHPLAGPDEIAERVPVIAARAGRVEAEVPQDIRDEPAHRIRGRGIERGGGRIGHALPPAQRDACRTPVHRHRLPQAAAGGECRVRAYGDRCEMVNFRFPEAVRGMAATYSTRTRASAPTSARIRAHHSASRSRQRTGSATRTRR